MFHTWSSQCQPQSNQPGYFAWWRGSSQEWFRSQIERSADMPPIKQPRSSPKGVGLDFMSCQDDAEFHIVPFRISWHLPKDRRFISWHHWTFEDVETTDLSMFCFWLVKSLVDVDVEANPIWRNIHAFAGTSVKSKTLMLIDVVLMLIVLRLYYPKFNMLGNIILLYDPLFGFCLNVHWDPAVDMCLILSFLEKWKKLLGRTVASWFIPGWQFSEVLKHLNHQSGFEQIVPGGLSNIYIYISEDWLNPI